MNEQNEIQNNEYPFGFGFALMQHPEAMAYLETVGEEEKKELLRQIGKLKTEDELLAFLRKLPPKKRAARTPRRAKQR